jgi:hypothetical protein
LPKSAVDIIGPAFEHTKKQLTQPFRVGQWARLALLALATGEMSSGGGCNNGFKGLGNFPSKFPNNPQNLVDPKDWLKGIDPAVLISVLLVLVVGLLVLGLVWMYVSSISRFVLFESVLRKHCELSESWNRWHSQGLRYFGWQLAIAFISLAIAGVLFIPLLLPVIATLKNHGQPGPATLLAFFPMLFVFGMFATVAMLIAVLTKDFVIPFMAIDGVGVIEGWRRLLGSMKAEKGAYVLYIVMKIVLAIGAAVVFGILSGIVFVICLLPIGIAGGLLFVLGRGAHLSWDAFTITAVVVAGAIVVAILLYVIALVCVPVAVFFPAYAMYFLADRYPGLSAQLFPAPPAAPPLPPQPPPLVPAPVPIG